MSDIEEQIKILNDERLRLVKGVDAGILSSESANERMLEINKIIENMIKMFPEHNEQELMDEYYGEYPEKSTNTALGILSAFPATNIAKLFGMMKSGTAAKASAEAFPNMLKDPAMKPVLQLLGLGTAKTDTGLKIREREEAEGMANGGEASFPDLTGDGKVTQADILKGRGVKMANGGEIDMALEDVSRGTMDMEAPQMQPSQEEMAAVQQIMDMVMQMMQAGASEEEIIAALKEMGLSDQDIAMVMQAIVEQGQQQNPIDAELSQMM